MDPSSPYAMRRLIELKDKFEVAFACDTDHDRHGIVTRSSGPASAQSLSRGLRPLSLPNRPGWRKDAGGGQNSGQQQHNRSGRRQAWAASYSKYRWDSNGSWTDCSNGSLGFAGEESAGASFLSRDGSVWSTDKDGLIAALLSAEITARTGPRSRRDLCRAVARARRVVLRTHRCAGQRRAACRPCANCRPRTSAASELAGETNSEQS